MWMRGHQPAQSWEQLFCRVVLPRQFLGEGLGVGDEESNGKTQLKCWCKDFLCSLFSFLFVAISNPLRRVGGKLKGRDDRTQCCGRIQLADVSFQRACARL